MGMTLKELEDLLWVLRDSQLSEDITFGPAVSAYNRRHAQCVKAVRKEIRNLKGGKETTILGD